MIVADSAGLEMTHHLPLPVLSVSYTGTVLIVLGFTPTACVIMCELVLFGTVFIYITHFSGAHKLCMSLC